MALYDDLYSYVISTHVSLHSFHMDLFLYLLRLCFYLFEICSSRQSHNLSSSFSLFSLLCESTFEVSLSQKERGRKGNLSVRGFNYPFLGLKKKKKAFPFPCCFSTRFKK